MKPDPIEERSHRISESHGSWRKAHDFDGGFHQMGNVITPMGEVNVGRWRNKERSHTTLDMIYRGRRYWAKFPLYSRQFSVTLAIRWVAHVQRKAQRGRR
jgi:hypothetical protein